MLNSTTVIHDEVTLCITVAQWTNDHAVTYEVRDRVSDQLNNTDLWYPLTEQEAVTKYNELVEYAENTEDPNNIP